MKETILIDVGSSTVKVYLFSNNKLSLILAKSIAFKKDFNPKNGISTSAKNQLIKLITKVKKENKSIPVKIYATAIFRKFSKSTYQKFSKQFHLKTGVKFKVISQDLENTYLQEALIGRYKGKKKIMLVNIGGGSTELVIVKSHKVLERKNIDFGVGHVLSKFPDINKNKSKVTLKSVTGFVDKVFPKMNKTAIAFYSGGELTYMRLAGYKLEENRLFKDEFHPFYISIENFKTRNKDIFNKITVKSLEKLMPANPAWMHGARACSALAQAIFEKYGVKTIIPSDVNLIDGIVAADFS